MPTMTPAQGRQAKHHPPRKKACKSCTRSKVRCGLERPACARCTSIGRACEYTTPSSVARIPDFHRQEDSPLGPPNTGNPLLHPSLAPSTSKLPSPGTGALLPTAIRTREHHITPDRTSEIVVDLTNTDLVPNDWANEIRDRWLRPYILPPGGHDEIPKSYHPFTLQYISRVLATYPHRMLRDGDVPPIIHHTQVARDRMPLSLANCYTLVRMWVQAAPGSEGIVVNTVQTEMDRLATEPPTLPDIHHLSAFQAYLVYTLLMYFSAPTGRTIVTSKTMITLMDLASRTAHHGLLSASELHRAKPSWESWIVASTKRRAVFAMYLFSSLYNAENSLPNFVAEELRGVLLPEGKALWDAPVREAWSREYDRYLGEWGDGMLDVSELWRSEETGSSGRRERVQRWVSTVDEFGMMLFGVCVHLHGC
ncbi:hypothetical protein BJX76DRAFT_41258 [Aspergillus varians]